ncbi:hypothetical protein CVD28_05215 [Bacillus sp. M6-12]|uniref:DinB family protein n=1 Tax=Bacillus sp. M6-12 TaxID=2054166 RepID=UPI000C77F7C2|nr:DinB family protein [Bacillus sp. M6-12]PLS18540.1 hypothetical protein CVD28_05215 [Bacillus sp. M6-12]
MSKTVEQYKSEIEIEIDQITKLVDGISDEKLFWKPSEDEWSIVQVLAHVEEILNYWVDELNRVISTPDAAWGRGFDDPARLDAVRQAHTRSFPEVMEGIGKAKNKVLTAFNEYKEQDLSIEAPHRNPKFGVKNMHFLVEHFIVEHLEKHITQIKRVQKQFDENHTNV